MFNGYIKLKTLVFLNNSLILGLNHKILTMKKLVLVLGVASLMSFGLSSCSKCAECSDQANVILTGEFCKGNAIEDALYESAKAECEAIGGDFN